MIGWLLLLAGGGYAAYRYSQGGGLGGGAGAAASSAAARTTFSGPYRQRLLQALETYEARGRGADAPSSDELAGWIDRNADVIAIAQRHKRPVMKVAQALAKDGGGGQFLYRAFPNEEIPEK